MTTSWLTTLDAFERHLDAQSELVRDGRYDEVVPFAPPLGLPTLPRALVARALGLLDRAQALPERAAALRDETMERLGRSSHLAFARPPVTAHVDQKV